MTRPWFDAQMSRLAILPFAPDTMDGHWEALQDIPPQVLQPAIAIALKGRTKFPVPADLRADCDAVVRQQRPAAVHPTARIVPLEGGIPVEIKNPFGGPSIHLTVTDAYRADCDECDDTGMVLFWCGEPGPTMTPWTYRRDCGRRHAHGSHDWATQCPCVATNPTIQRKKAAQGQRFASEPEKVGR